MINYYRNFPKFPKIRTFCLILCVLGVLSLLCACADREDIPAEYPDGLFFSITGIHNAETVGSVNEEAVPAELYLYWLSYSCRYWEDYVYSRTGRHIDWDAPVSADLSYGDFVKEEAGKLTKLQLLTEQWARQYGAVLSPEQEATLSVQRQDYLLRFGGQAGYEAALFKQGLSEKSFDRIRRLGEVYEALETLAKTPGSSLYPETAALARFAVEQGWSTGNVSALAEEYFARSFQAAAENSIWRASPPLARLDVSGFVRSLPAQDAGEIPME